MVREQLMNMSGTGGSLSVPSEHLPGLVAFVAVTLLFALGLWVLRKPARRELAWASAASDRWHELSFAARAALFGVLVGAAVHGALVLTHWSEERTIALLFVAD